MNREEKIRLIEEIFKLCPTDSILIINKNMQLERIYCPFLVEVIKAIPPLMPGDKEQVTEVGVSLELIDVYFIKGRAYYFYNFRIIS